MDKESLKALRKQFDMTQEQLGAALTPKYSRFAVNAWEKGKSRIPANIGEMLAAANLRAPQEAKQRTKPINPESHPQCFTNGHKNLAHPRWYIDSPISQFDMSKIPPEFRGAATPADFEAHVAPSPETVWQMFQDQILSRPMSDKFRTGWHRSCLEYMNKLGYTQFGTPEKHVPEVPTSAIIGL